MNIYLYPIVFSKIFRKNKLKKKVINGRFTEIILINKNPDPVRKKMNNDKNCICLI
jgi:hypothetical protein